MKRKVRPAMGTIFKRKATNSAKQTLYLMMWGEEVPKKCKKA